MKKWVILSIVVLIILAGIYFYFGKSFSPNPHEACIQRVQRENSFCATVEEEQCKYYHNYSNSIPGGGNCYWSEEMSSCSGETRGCD